MTITATKVNVNVYTAGNGRFTLTAMRSEGGYIRDWEMKENGTDRKGRSFERVVGYFKNKTLALKEAELRLSRELPKEKWDEVRAYVKVILHAGRDTMRNRREVTSQFGWSANNPDWCQAYGVLDGLATLGHLTRFPRVNGPDVLVQDLSPRDVLSELEKEVLEEEHFKGDGRCEHCLKKYGKDDRSLRESGEEQMRENIKELIKAQG